MSKDGIERRWLLKAALVSPLGAAALQSCTGEDGLGVDAGTKRDAGSRDGGFFDGGSRDGGLADAGITDAGAVDSGATRDGGSACTPTGADVEGPFHRAGAPSRMNLVDANEPGDPLVVAGVVQDIDCAPIGGALLDVWQADANGNYDNDSVEYRLRGQLMTDADGNFEITTIRPGSYLDGGGFRPAHIHFIVTHPAHVALTTQLYFSDDPYLKPNDSCGVCNSGDPTIIIDLEASAGAAEWTGAFSIVLEPR